VAAQTDWSPARVLGPDGAPARMAYRGGMSQPPKIRRAPNIPAFLLTGGVVGLVLGILLAVMGHNDSRYDAPAALAFFGLIGAAFGVLIGGVVAVLLDRKS
jgi:hypothetical protein